MTGRVERRGKVGFSVRSEVSEGIEEKKHEQFENMSQPQKKMPAMTP